jgi:hypothetical protein
VGGKAESSISWTRGGQVVRKQFWKRIIAGAILLALPSAAGAEVQRIELDVAGYLCGR